LSAPSTVAIGDLVTAAQHQELVDRLGAGTSYAAVISNFTSGTIAATVNGRSWRLGDQLAVLVQGKLGTGTITVGNLTINTPRAIDTTIMIADSTALAGYAAFNDVSATTEYHGMIRMVDANNVRLLRPNTTTVGAMTAVTASAPFTFATLDEVSAFFLMPIA
jgi:bifunctional ADP-heptose synthase (sugar kinase/adenylyltransferase)